MKSKSRALCNRNLVLREMVTSSLSSRHVTPQAERTFIIHATRPHRHQHNPQSASPPTRLELYPNNFRDRIPLFILPSQPRAPTASPTETTPDQSTTQPQPQPAKPQTPSPPPAPYTAASSPHNRPRPSSPPPASPAHTTSPAGTHRDAGLVPRRVWWRSGARRPGMPG